jgi:hypothetical protein
MLSIRRVVPIRAAMTRRAPASTMAGGSIIDRLAENTRERTVSLGKALLVSRLQVLLQTRRVHLPRTAEAETLARELLDYEIHVDEQANDRYGAFRVGSHDDMVTSLGLAVLAVERAAPVGVWFAR